MATLVKMPRLSKGMGEGEVVEWLKSPGDSVREGEPLVIVLSEKADVEVDAPTTGILLKVLAQPGEEVSVGAGLAWIGQPGEALDTSPVAAASAAETRDIITRLGQSAAAQQPPVPTSGGKVKASPAARRVASERGIPLESLIGSGPGGLITESDVQHAFQAWNETAAGTVDSATPIQETEVERVPLRGLRKVMAERMAHSKRTAADVTTVVDVDMTAVRAIKAQIPITYTSAVVKATSLALQDHPILNATLDGEVILFHKHIHMGVAVDAPQGLRVVTIASANTKPLRQVDDELRERSEKARAGRVPLETLETPTFTVTNSGVLGSLMFTPIINPPESATLGIGKVQDTPVVRNGQIVVGPVMYLCLTYDHRLIEGAEAVRFLGSVKGLLEDPRPLL